MFFRNSGQQKSTEHDVNRRGLRAVCVPRTFSLLPALLLLALAAPATAEPITSQSLNALAKQLCPWQPEGIPPLVLLDDEAYEADERAHGRDGTGGAFVVLRPPYVIYMRISAASDRLLCHEWRHIVEPDSWLDHK